MQAQIEKRAAFSQAEHQARIARARHVLRERNFDAVICFAPEHIYYFTGYDGHTQFSIQSLIFGAGDDEPTLVLRDVDRMNAEETCWAKDIRFYHHAQQDPARLILDAVRERVSGNGKVGACLNTYALPGAFAVHLTEMAELKLTETTALIEPLRYVKSEQEMAYIRKAAAYAELGLTRLREVAAPGMTEIELTGEIEAAMRAAGSEYSAMPTLLSSGPRTRGSHRTPTGRTIQRGDNIKTEFAGISHRYHAVTMQTLWLGEPSANARSTYGKALAALRAGMREITVGTPVADAEAAAFDSLRASGFNVSAHARFGYGVSAAYPPSWLEGLDITTDSSAVFAANMSFVLHCIVTSEEGLGMLIGGAYATTDQRLVVLSGGDLELTVV